MIEALPRVLAQIPDARCVILGEGDALGAIRQRANQLGVAEAVEFSGHYLPIEQALERVAGSSCGVIPNRPTQLNRFALSSKLFEYVALGVPSVVARLATLAGHFDRDEVGFFEPGDPDSLAHAVTWVAQHPAESEAMAARALARSREYAWSANQARYLAVIASASRASRAPGQPAPRLAPGR